MTLNQGMLNHICISTAWEARAGMSQVQSHSGLHSEL